MAVKVKRQDVEHLLEPGEPGERRPKKTRKYGGRSHGPRHTPGVMNGTEKKYSELLEGRRETGEIVKWEFEPDKLSLSEKRRCTYTPDFKVTFPDERIEYHEVKGFMKEDAWIKLKWASEKFRSTVFRICVYKKGQWVIKVV